MTAAEALDVLLGARLVAVVRSERPVPTALALARAGVRVLDVSLTSLDPYAAIAQVRARAPHVLVGAGTVLSVADARRAYEHGAGLLVSPDLDLDVVAWAAEHDVLHLPGVLTPSEMTSARRAGARALKLFPAGRDAARYVREVLAPLPDLRLVPTGGLGATEAEACLAAGAVAVGLGSALAPRHLDGDALVAHARGLLERLRLAPVLSGHPNEELP